MSTTFTVEHERDWLTGYVRSPRCPDCGKSDKVTPDDGAFRRCTRCLATFEANWEDRRRK